MMHWCRVASIVLVLMGASYALAEGGEEKALEALARIQAGIEEGVSCEELDALLDKAKMRIDRLEKDYVGEDCFRRAVRRSYYWYRLGLKSSEIMAKNEEARNQYARRADYGDHRWREISLKMVANYDKLIRHAREALPSKWRHGHMELHRARKCVNR